MIAPAALFLLLGRSRPFRLGLAHGLVAWMLSLEWIVHTVTTYGQLAGWLGGLALLLLALFLGLYTGLFTWLGSRLWRRGDLPSLAALPALWVALEWLRSHLVTGFPWNLAAHAWVDLPAALPISAWIGAYGVSYLALLPGLGLARSWVSRRVEPALLGLLIPALLLPVGARFAGGPREGGREPREARIVQPNSPARPVFDPRLVEADYRRLLERSRAVCKPGTLLVWPESAAWPFAWASDPVLRADVGELIGRGCAVLVNTPHEAENGTRNSLLLAAPAATEPQRYDKRHLVPFGEYVPLARALPFLPRLARAAGDFVPADGITLLDWEGERIGAAICYEVVFPGEVAALVRAGATVLVTVTNDSWYGDTAAPWQHLRAARFRAAENRRWLLRAAITGVSARIAPDGEVRGELGVDQEGTLFAPFLGRSDLAFYTRAPWLVPALASLFAAAMLARAGWRRLDPTDPRGDP